MWKIKFIFFIVAFILPLQVFAIKSILPQDNCSLLGPEPSLIVKFKNISSKEKPILDLNMLQKLSSTQAIFTKAKAMSGGAYILFFKPKSSLLSAQVKPYCYSNAAIKSLIEELKTKANIEYIDPNILMTVAEFKNFSNITISPKQWNLLAPPGGIDAETAFDTTTGSPNSITAVLDTGILSNNSLTPNLLNGVTGQDPNL